MKGSSEQRSAQRVAGHQKKLVVLVTRWYKKARYQQPVVCSNLDPEPGKQSYRWSDNSCHFTLDVRRAVARAVENHSDRGVLVNAWARLVRDIDDEDNEKLDETQLTLVKLLAPAFKPLHPGAYFKRSYQIPGRRATAA